MILFPEKGERRLPPSPQMPMTLVSISRVCEPSTGNGSLQSMGGGERRWYGGVTSNQTLPSNLFLLQPVLHQHHSSGLGSKSCVVLIFLFLYPLCPISSTSGRCCLQNTPEISALLAICTSTLWPTAPSSSPVFAWPFPATAAEAIFQKH